MPLLEVEARKLTQNTLQRGVLETIITLSDVLKVLPFQTVEGNAIQYTREATIPLGAFVAVNGVIPESAATFTTATAALKIMAQHSDLDLFLKKTLGNYNDQSAQVVKGLTKSSKRLFENTFIYGNATTNPLEFDGLDAMVDSTMQIHASASMDATGAAASFYKLDTLIDLLDEKPSCLITNRTMKRRLRASGRGDLSLTGDTSKLSVDGGSYDGIPIVIDDFITQTETIASGIFTAKTGGATTSIFACYFDETSGLTGLKNGNLETENIGRVPNKHAERWEQWWYVALALKSVKALARYDGITDAAWTV